MFNCCLINIGDMLDNGTVMHGKLIESPKSFQVACTVMTQIIASVASAQYGGQSVDISHLGKYLRRSRDKFRKRLVESTQGSLSEKELNEILDARMKEELASGVQTIQYQINTLMTTNGQSPFVTLFLHLDPKDEYIEENAQIIEEILKPVSYTHLVGMGGKLYRQGLIKMNEFVTLCSRDRLPIIWIQDTSGIDVGNDAEKAELLGLGQSLIYSIQNSNIPQFEITLRKGSAAAHYVLGGPQGNDTNAFSIGTAATEI